MVVAEIGASHCGSLTRALELVDAAYEAGADAVKLQTWDEMTVCDQAIAAGPWAGRSWRELYEQCKTPWAWHWQIFDRCRQHGMIGFSTPFDVLSVDFLEAQGVSLYKIASFEITDLQLIRKVASTGKPIVISTGLATLEEIAEAVTAARAAGCAGLTLLKCVSAYPAPIEGFNLVTMADLHRHFHCGVGLSDHTAGSVLAVAAVGMGASLIEKHISIDHEGPDGGFASTPEDFACMVANVRAAASAFGQPRYGPSPAEASSLMYRRSLWVTCDTLAGELFTQANVGVLRPAAGLAPHFLEDVIGKRAARDVARGTPIMGDLLA